jgi:hypothetical protein
MSGKIGGASFSVLLVDGYDFLATKVKTFSHKVESLLEESDGLGDAIEAKLPTGLQKVTLSQGGAFFDDTANRTHDALKALPQTSRLVAFAFAGNVIGRIFVGVQGVFGIAYEVLGQVAALTKANAAYQANGLLDRGVILQHWVAKTISWNTKTDGQSVDYTQNTAQLVIPITSNTAANPSVVTTPVPHGLTSGDIILISGVATSSPTINGERTVTVISPTQFSVPVNVTTPGTGGSFVRSNSRNGGAGYLEVSAYSGFTSVVVKIRSSPDDVTYADLITFTTVTAAPAAERIAVAGTVDRYLCVTGTVTGSGSITPFVGFARG